MRYREIADRWAQTIVQEMRPGDALPGVRELAKSEGVSLVTARNVYQLLAQRGLVVTRQGSGTLVAHGAADDMVDMSAIRAPEEMLLWVGRHLSVSHAGLSTYDPPQGFAPLCEQASFWLKRLGIDGAPIITAGSQQALFLAALALLKPGDVVAVEDPGYLGALKIFEMLGAEVRRIDYIQSESDLDQLRDDRIKLFYTMPQGQIPTGAAVPAELRPELLQIAAQHDFYILEDDPLSELLGIAPLKAQDRDGRVIYVKSLSNYLGPGMRIGFCVVPDNLYASMLDFKEINDIALSGILQRILCSMLESGELQNHVQRLRKELGRRQHFLRDALGWQVNGVCAWLETGSPSRLHAERLKAEDVLITPGDIYGVRWSNHIRLSILTPASARFEPAVRRVADYLARESGPGLTAF